MTGYSGTVHVWGLLDVGVLLSLNFNTSGSSYRAPENLWPLSCDGIRAVNVLSLLFMIAARFGLLE